MLCRATALGVQQPSLLGASPSMYSQQSALAAASLNTQSAANYQISQQTAALQQQAAAAAAAALQQVSRCKCCTILRYVHAVKVLEFWHESTHSEKPTIPIPAVQHLLAKDRNVLMLCKELMLVV